VPTLPFAACDSRLLGAWRSDRERTVAEWSFKNEAIRALFERNFGRLLVRYTESLVYTEFDGDTTVCRYRIATIKAESVEIVCETEPDDEVRTLNFVSADVYWVSVGSNREFFRRENQTGEC